MFSSKVCHKKGRKQTLSKFVSGDTDLVPFRRYVDCVIMFDLNSGPTGITASYVPDIRAHISLKFSLNSFG